MTASAPAARAHTGAVGRRRSRRAAVVVAVLAALALAAAACGGDRGPGGAATPAEPDPAAAPAPGTAAPGESPAPESQPGTAPPAAAGGETPQDREPPADADAPQPPAPASPPPPAPATTTTRVVPPAPPTDVPPPGADGALGPGRPPLAGSTEREAVPSALLDRYWPGFATLIDPELIVSGGPGPDGIPAIDAPRFAPAGEIDFLADDEAVLGLEIGGEARAYPLQIMTWHELVNDTVGGVAVTVSYCPLCNSAVAVRHGHLYDSGVVEVDLDGVALVVWNLPGTSSALDGPGLDDGLDVGASGVFERQLDGRLLSFTRSGDGFGDTATGSVWNLFGEAVAGELAGRRLVPREFVDTFWFAWGTFEPESRIVPPP